MTHPSVERGLQLRADYPRTVCACEACVTCCKHMPGSLAPGDLERILLHQKATADPTAWLLEHFQASDGARAMKMTPRGPQIIPIRTIVPKLTDTGCVFLKEGKCSIHEVAPFGCAYMDTHQQGREAAHALGAAQVQDWAEGGTYAQAWEVLHDAGKDAIPLGERKQKLMDALEILEETSPRV